MKERHIHKNRLIGLIRTEEPSSDDTHQYKSNNNKLYLHSDDGVNEKQHCNEQADIRQSFERLNEGPEQNSDCVSLAQQLNQTGRTEQTQEAHVKRICLFNFGFVMRHNEWHIKKNNFN